MEGNTASRAAFGAQIAEILIISDPCWLGTYRVAKQHQLDSWYGTRCRFSISLTHSPDLWLVSFDCNFTRWVRNRKSDSSAPKQPDGRLLHPVRQRE